MKIMTQQPDTTGWRKKMRKMELVMMMIGVRGGQREREERETDPEKNPAVQKAKLATKVHPIQT